MNDKALNFALTLAAKLDPLFKKSFAIAGASVDKLGNALQQAEKTKREYDRILSQQRATLEAAQNFAKLKERLAAVGAQMKASGGANAQLSAEYSKLQTAVKRAGAALETEKASLASMKAAAGATGMSLEQLIAKNKALAESAKQAASAQRFGQIQQTVASKRTDAGLQFGVGVAQLAMIKSAASSLAAPIKLGMDFDKTMSKVGAVSQATAEDLEKLRAQARELGASTVWSASQAAEGMTYLAMAGFKTEDTLKAMPGMLSLASAGAVDLGTAADIASNMLSGFSLSADQIGRVGDVMVNTFTNSNTTLGTLGETMKYVAPVAQSLGVSIEETAAMAGKLGDAGIQGSMAGTALRAVMNNLAAPTSSAAKALYALNVSVKDADGNMRSMPDLLAEIGKKLKKLPQTAQAAIKKDLFGTEAMSAATVLMDNAVNGSLQNFIEKVKESGSASRVAGEQTNNLSGDLANLSSAWEEVQLIVSETVTPALRTVSQTLTNVISTVGAFAKEHQGLTKALAVGAAALGGIVASMAAFNMLVGGAGYILMSAVGGFMKLWSVISMVKNALIAFKAVMIVVNAVMIANPIGLVITLIGALIAGLAALIIYWDDVKAGASACWGWFSEKFPKTAETITQVVGHIADTVSTMWNSLKTVLSNIIDFVTNVFTGNWQGAWENVKNIFGAAFKGLTALIKAPLNAVISLVNKAFEAIGGINISIPDWVPGLGGKEFGFNLPQIPMLAKGGVVTAPTMAMIGEGSEPEAVLPLSKLEELLNTPQEAIGGINGGNFSVTFNPTINVTVSGEEQRADAYTQVRKALTEASDSFAEQMRRYQAQRGRMSYD